MPRLTPTYIAFSLAACLLAPALLAAQPTANTPTTQNAFSYAGTVVDRDGNPIAGVEVIATDHEPDDSAYSYIDDVETDAHGNFKIDRAVALSGAPDTAGIVRLEFRHPDYEYDLLENLRLFTHEQVTHLHVILHHGFSVAGRVLNDQHQPMAGVSVEVTFDKFDKAHHLRRATTTDKNGQFELHGLPGLTGQINALTVDPSQPALTARQTFDPDKENARDMLLAPITLPQKSAIHELFGMKLIDVDSAIQQAFHLSSPDGVLVLDPGKNSQRLAIGRLQRGDQFWIVGEKPVKDFADFKAKLLAESKSQPTATIRVVYRFQRPDFSGSNTQFMELTKADIDSLSR